MSKTYRIQIDMFSDEDTKVIDKRTVITCDTNYMLATAISEWVREEIDPRATIDYHALADAVTETAGDKDATIAVSYAPCVCGHGVEMHTLKRRHGPDECHVEPCECRSYSPR